MVGKYERHSERQSHDLQIAFKAVKDYIKVNKLILAHNFRTQVRA